jgi:hypothetical protein
MPTNGLLHLANSILNFKKNINPNRDEKYKKRGPTLNLNYYTLDLKD